jgi:hypothetical protein
MEGQCGATGAVDESNLSSADWPRRPMLVGQPAMLLAADGCKPGCVGASRQQGAGCQFRQMILAHDCCETRYSNRQARDAKTPKGVENAGEARPRVGGPGRLMGFSRGPSRLADATTQPCLRNTAGELNRDLGWS